LFMAGILPGIIYGLVFILVISYMGYKLQFPKSERLSWADIRSKSLKVIPALLIPITIVVGILTGVFTPVQSAAIA
uniref:TRAP transporter large permease subunit n=1 Tax=Lysinibacillus fusiformis TaxID=28031 RepID=UPI0020BD90F6